MIQALRHPLLAASLLASVAAPFPALSETEPARWTTNHLAGTGEGPLPYAAEPAWSAHAFQRPVDLDPLPGTRRLMLLELGGGLWSFDQDAEPIKPVELLRYAHPKEGRPPKGLKTYSITFDPAYPERPFLYLSSNRRDGPQGRNRLSRLTVVDPETGAIDPASELVILEWDSTGHDGCDLKFGPDGHLYASSGDGAVPGDPDNVGQTTDNLLGSILRLDVRHATAAQPYRLPDDNPYLETEGIRPEVWAYGLRNPWRMNFRPGSDELFLGDNGDEHWELVRLVSAGSNHGWSAYEGSHPFRLGNALAGPAPVLTPPVMEHPHREMRSVIGGLFYRGATLPELRGHYLYACYVTGRIWGLRWDPESQKASDARRLADSRGKPVGFAEDHEGEAIVIDHDGRLLRLRSAPKDVPVRPVPETLSQTGLFSDTRRQQPARGVVPYTIKAKAWFDGASRRTWMAIPVFDPKSTNPQERGVDARVGEAQQKSWRFPSGSAFAQTLYFPDADAPSGERRVETQVMHKDRGEWHFLTYRWNEDQTDATLVPMEGLDAPVELPKAAGHGDTENRPWRFLSRAECTACHTQRSFFTLGPSTAQLDQSFDPHAEDAGGGNQLDQLAALEIFIEGREPRPGAVQPAVSPDDPDASLVARARSYLHVNCAHCHRETGLGGRAQFQLLRWLSLPETGVIDALPLVGLPGVDNARILAPGDPDRSELVRRMESRDIGKMPLIGRHQIDAEGIALIREWIAAMQPSQVAAANPPSPAAQNEPRFAESPLSR